MRLGFAVVLVCVSSLLAEDAQDQDLAYLAAWYDLEVEENPQRAKKAFDSLLAIDALPAERRAMCTVGLARCTVALGDRQGAISIYRSALRLADGLPKVEQRIEKALTKIGRGAHTGEFQLQFKQGYHFGTDEVVDATSADVRFARCAGGISSIEFGAPGGIVNLEEILARRKTNLDARLLYEGVTAAFTDRLKLALTAKADSRTPESEVFIVRTRGGGWAKFAIVDRTTEDRSWQKWTATIVYSYHPDRPVFGPLPVNAGQLTGPVIFNRELTPTKAELEARTKRRQARIDAASEDGGRMPEHGTTQEVLLNRQEFHDYEKATFSFYFGVRDDPGRRMVRNDWELAFTRTGPGRDLFFVRMIVDDRSTITDLGESTWADLAQHRTLQSRQQESVPAHLGHLYLVHTLDNGANSHSLFRVVAHRPGIACHIEWVSLRTKAFRSSPGLKLSSEQKTALERLLRNVKPAPLAAVDR